MNPLSDFAGRYAPFVLPAYGVAAVVVAAMTFDTLRLANRWRRAAREAEPIRRPPPAESLPPG